MLHLSLFHFSHLFERCVLVHCLLFEGPQEVWKHLLARVRQVGRLLHGSYCGGIHLLVEGVVQGGGAHEVL